MNNSGKSRSPYISVIVVVYNAESTLERCLDSIVSQSLKEIELIIVNDGSTDSSLAIINRYKSFDKRIIAVSQANSGVGAARQKGLDLATGDYTIFVDSDDWIEKNMLELLYEKATRESADIVFCDYIEENGLGSFYRKQEPKSKDSRIVLTQIFRELHGSLCNKLIRRSLYHERGVRFVEGLNYCEDEYVVINLLSSSCKVAYVNKGLYHYDKNANACSISNLWSIRPVQEYKLYIASCSTFFNSPELQKQFDNKIAEIIKTLTYAPKDSYKESRSLYRFYKKAFLNSNLPLSKKLFCILYYNGFRYIAQLRGFYHNQH